MIILNLIIISFYSERQQYLSSKSQIEVPIMGSDQERKLAIAKTRYMDK